MNVESREKTNRKTRKCRYIKKICWNTKDKTKLGKKYRLKRSEEGERTEKEEDNREEEDGRAMQEEEKAK